MGIRNKVLAVAACTMAFMGGAAYTSIHDDASVNHADAAVLVIDQQNIAEAIKTVLNTTNILTEEQKQLALKIIDMQSLDPNVIASYIRQQTGKQQEIWDEHQQKVGGLQVGNSADSYIRQHMGGDINDILNGNFPVMTLVSSNQNGIKSLEATARDALHNAKTVQNGSYSINLMLNDAVKNSGEAQGSKEAIQANTQTIGVHTIATLQTNDLLSDVLAMQAVKYSKEAHDQAVSISVNEQMNDKLQNYSNSMPVQSNKSTYDVALEMYGPELAQYYR